MAGPGNSQPALNTYLGIDCGTSAVRICAIDDQEQIQALTSHSLETQSPDSWQTALRGCLQDLFRLIPAETVRSIAVDGTSGTILLCDETGLPLTGAIMYNDAAYGDELKKLDAPEAVPALSATAGLPKAMHLASRTKVKDAIVVHQSDWLSGWLGGQVGFSDENNALKTGYDPQQRAWPPWVRSALPSHVQLPEVVIPGTQIGSAARILQDLGVSPHTSIRAGTTDSTASFLATGADNLDRGVTTLGSTLVIKQLCQTQIIDLGRGIYSHRLGDSWLTGGASNSGGAVLKHFFTVEEIEQLSRHINPEQETGLHYYPLLEPGERFPVYDPGLQPGLSPRPELDSDFLHAMFEGIATIEKTGYQTLNSLGCDRIKRIETTGGGAANAVWTRIREKITGCPIAPAQHTEAAYGSALLAKYGSSLFDRFS
jgi:sugar (pentulose or hexulose) kinase